MRQEGQDMSVQNREEFRDRDSHRHGKIGRAHV